MRADHLTCLQRQLAQGLDHLAEAFVFTEKPREVPQERRQGEVGHQEKRTDGNLGMGVSWHQSGNKEAREYVARDVSVDDCDATIATKGGGNMSHAGFLFPQTPLSRLDTG